MSKSTTVIPKKRGPKPTGKGTPLMVRVQPDLLDGIDAYSADETDNPSRPESVRRLLRDHLIGLGYLELPPAKEAAN